MIFFVFVVAILAAVFPVDAVVVLLVIDGGVVFC